MRKVKKFVFRLCCCFIASLLFFQWSMINGQWSPARADELEEIEKQIAELENLRQQSISATIPLEKELDKLEEKLASIQQGLKKAEDDLVLLEQSIVEREKDFERHYVILSERVENYYKSLYGPSKFLTLLSTQTASTMAKDVFYRQIVADEDKKIIAQISTDILSLETDKKKVEDDKIKLAELQKKTDEQAAFFRKEVKGAKDYQAELSSKIATLTARQQQIIAQKLGSLNLPTSLGAGPLYCTDDRKLDPGFSPAFAFYTYGIPHRVGMNQYGAYGRGKAGQDYRAILQAYFNGIGFENRDATIKVQGHGSYPLEEYVKRIYEVPDSWPVEALKAQVVAARSYALAYTNNGANEICTTQQCQVWKPEPKGGNWEQAVNATAGEVMVNGGQPIKAWYSSTDGGYTHTSGEVWGGGTAYTKNLRDTSANVNSFSDLQGTAYDRDSPCFYAAQGWRNEYGKSAWLRPSEVADIANVIMLARYSDVDKNHLYQVDKPNPEGVETWSADKVRQELSALKGSPILSANSVSVTGVDFGGGRTTQISINGVPFSGSEFKDWFNLRAPANIQIVGPLYNVEKR